MMRFQNQLNILCLIIICAALGTAFWFEFVLHKNPCPLCLFQRLAMAGIGLSAVMNIRFGPRVEHYAFSILFAAVGCLVSFRLTPFGGRVMGYSLSSWSAMVFVGSIVAAAVLLLFFSQTKPEDTHPRWGLVEKSVFSLFSLLIVGNILSLVLSSLEQ
jgi:disulfide bond formation protein DsbB